MTIVHLPANQAIQASKVDASRLATSESILNSVKNCTNSADSTSSERPVQFGHQISSLSPPSSTPSTGIVQPDDTH